MKCAAVFQVEETLTWADWDAFRKTYALHGRLTGGALRALAGVQRGLGAFFAALGGFLLLMGLLGGVLDLLTALGAALLAGGVLAFRKRDVRETLSERRVERAYQANIPDTPMRLTFDDDGFSAWGPSGTGSYRYHAVTAVWEDADRFYLLIRGEIRYILKKEAFSAGRPEAFPTFVEEKTGRPVESIR